MRRLPPLSLALGAALLAAACGTPGGTVGSTASSAPPSTAQPTEPGSPASSAPSPSASTAAESSLLLTLAYRGGHCRTGPCDRTLGIDRDGRAHVVLPEPLELGALPPNLIQQVQQQLSLADFEALGSRPFTGECPVNFDGQELIYTFYGATGEIRLASCEVELDPTHPLLVAIEAALAAVQQP